MKFAFLIALIIAFVAVSSAAWTIDNEAATVAPGQQVTFMFSTDAAVEAPATLPVYTTTFFESLIVAGEGVSIPVCTSGGKTVATSAITATAFTLSFVQDLAIDAVVSCVVRVDMDAADKATFALNLVDPDVDPDADGDIVFTIAEALLTVEITSATANDDKTTQVELKFSDLTANTLYGPFTVGYTFKTATSTAMAATDHLETWLETSDFAASFDANVRFVVTGDGLWVLTGATAPASASVSVQYYYYTVYQGTTESGESYFAYIKQNTETAVTKEVATVTKTDTVNASIYIASKTASWSISVSKSVAKPVFKFSIDKYTAEQILGTDATLSYSAPSGSGSITIVAGQFEYTLDTIVADETVTVSGSFPVTTYELATIDASIGSQSDSATVIVGGMVKSVNAVSVADDVLTFSYIVTSTVPTDLTFDGSVDYNIYSALSYATAYGDVRAFDAYMPTCTSASGSVSVGDKLTKDNLDLNSIWLMSSGSLEKSTTEHTVTCTQNLHAGSKQTVTITVGTQTATQTFTATATEKFNQQVIIYAKAITDAATMDTVIAEVVTLLIAEADDKSGDETVAADYEFHYKANTAQHYVANVVGLNMDYSNVMVQHYSTAGSMITLLFNRKTDTTALSATLYGADKVVQVSASVDAADMDGLVATAAYVDGATAVGHALSTSVQNGFGFKCATSAQCLSGYCLEGVCSEWGQLSRVQQAAAAAGSEDGSSASAVFTTLALAIAVVALLF